MRDQETIRSKDDLVRLFSDAVQPSADRMRVGPEMEKFGVTADGKPLAYDSGVTRVLDSLEPYGWVSESEKSGGPRIALKRGEASVTLEPGGQLELSGAPADDIHAIVAEMDQHLEEIEPISKELGIRWLGIGFHPFAKLEDFSWVPKARYTIMREYLKTRGSYGLDMMHRTCTVQGNYDFTSLEDAMRKVRLGLKLAPLVAAMFANSPWLEGAPHGGVSFRARVWLDVDPDRSGLVPSIWHETSTVGDYIEWALDVPMFLFKRNGEVVANTGQTFRSFWKNGFGGHAATQADWQLHVNTLFPEVRLKRTIEIRSADAQGRAIAAAVPGLYTGLYYDPAALAGAEALVKDWTYEEVRDLQTRVWKDGLRATFKGAPLAKQAEALFDLARGGLVRRARLDAKGRDESVHMEALGKLVSQGMTPADDLLEKTRGATDLRAAILDATAL
jgi:glutamate--cysteine ligase